MENQASGKNPVLAISPITKCIRGMIWFSAFLMAFFSTVVVFNQMRKDALSERVATVLAERIVGHSSPLGEELNVHPLAVSLSNWQNHKPKAAPVWDKIWNSRYPAVAGVVKTQEELNQVKEIVRTVCQEHRYDPQLVGFFVRQESKELGGKKEYG